MSVLILQNVGRDGSQVGYYDRSVAWKKIIFKEKKGGSWKEWKPNVCTEEEWVEEWREENAARETVPVPKRAGLRAAAASHSAPGKCIYEFRVGQGGKVPKQGNNRKDSVLGSPGAKGPSWGESGVSIQGGKGVHLFPSVPTQSAPSVATDRAGVHPAAGHLSFRLVQPGPKPRVSVVLPVAGSRPTRDASTEKSSWISLSHPYPGALGPAPRRLGEQDPPAGQLQRSLSVEVGGWRRRVTPPAPPRAGPRARPGPGACGGDLPGARPAHASTPGLAPRLRAAPAPRPRAGSACGLTNPRSEFKIPAAPLALRPRSLFSVSVFVSTFTRVQLDRSSAFIWDVPSRGV